MPTDTAHQRDALLRVLGLLRRQRWAAATAVALGVVVILLTNALPLVIRRIIDHGLLHDSDATTSGLALLLGLAALRWLGDVVRREVSGQVGLRLEADLRARLFGHLLSLDAGWHGRTEAGRVLSLVGSDLRIVRAFVSYSALFILLNTLTAAAALIQIWRLSWPVGVAATAVLPLFGLVTIGYGRRTFAASAGLQERVAALTTHAEENAAGMRVVKGLGRENEEVQAFTRRSAEVRDHNVALSALQARYLPWTIGLPEVGLVLIVWFGGYLTIRESLTVGTLVALSTYMALLVWPVSSMVGLFGSARRAAASAARVFAVLDEPLTVADRPGAVDLPRASGGASVTFDDLCFRYPGGTWPGLRRIRLDVAAGEHVTIEGVGGSGKSALAGLLVRLWLPDSGRLMADGIDVADLTLDSVRAAVGYVPQDAVLFNGTVRENLLVGHPTATATQLDRALRLAAADELVRTLPKGLQTVVGDHGHLLSGGQRQRLALARAVLPEPRVLVLDDALTQIDTETRRRVRNRLEELAGAVTVLHLTRPGATGQPHGRVVTLTPDGALREITGAGGGHR
ncbi:ABC transporter ATP-binding protein [Micromonospora sp. WMMD980]|uniref:ABC transporter ATP-binding protein n=1 Tax=Micromonospora sp. WMMD980 TaxID=3016088 RepID=UPI002417731A|nr:ABC transporter ATP-binding protein [Micromonospora sp. WMMD980]MDG4803127.1 ABC transporter ATP-binding protein [Micromonospora sp. WMMD980]